jgi:DNA repair protein RecN (Recombination protein N)
MMSKTEFKASLQAIAADEKTNPYLTANHHMISETGTDRATFLIAPNIGEALKPLAMRSMPALAEGWPKLLGKN